jgi:hypothetical protein
MSTRWQDGARRGVGGIDVAVQLPLGGRGQVAVEAAVGAYDDHVLRRAGFRGHAAWRDEQAVPLQVRAQAHAGIARGADIEPCSAHRACGVEQRCAQPGQVIRVHRRCSG